MTPSHLQHASEGYGSVFLTTVFVVLPITIVVAIFVKLIGLYLESLVVLLITADSVTFYYIS